MRSFCAPRSLAWSWTWLLATALLLIQSCCTCPKTKGSPAPVAALHPATGVDGLPPSVRGRARWFNQPTLPKIASFDIVEEQSQGPATANQLQISWKIPTKPPPAPAYPGEAQYPDNRTLSISTPLDWHENGIVAINANGTESSMATIEVQVLVTDINNAQWTFHKVLALDEKWYDFDTP